MNSKPRCLPLCLCLSTSLPLYLASKMALMPAWTPRTVPNESPFAKTLIPELN